MGTKIETYFSLKDQVVFVTGALGLIGKHVCRVIAEAGATVVLSDLLPHDEIACFASELSDAASTMALELDVSNQEAVEAGVKQTVQKYGKIDTLIHLAAIDAKFDTTGVDKVPKMAFENFPLELWKKSVDVNMTGSFIVTQAVVKEMIKHKKGNIILVGSTYSLVAPNQSLYLSESGEQTSFKPVDYVGSKSFVPNFTRYLATFYGKQGIRANCIIPHGINNNHPEHFKKRFAMSTPLGRMCEPSEIKGPFLFLSSQASSYMTGSTLVVDGGWTAW